MAGLNLSQPQYDVVINEEILLDDELTVDGLHEKEQPGCDVTRSH